MEKGLRQIFSELDGLRREVWNQRPDPSSDRTCIEIMLKRRGVRDVKYTAPKFFFLPEPSRKEAEEALYAFMKKYSFRIFLRDLISSIDNLTPPRLNRYCSEDVALKYIKSLLEYGMLLQRSDGTYYFAARQRLVNFGDMLEWFVAQIMRKEFLSPAIWGCRFKHRKIGGDYDVISVVEGRLLYIEVKSSPPKHIDMPEIRAFMDRVCFLRPDAAIFLEDTHLRMKDKLVVMFEDEMRRRFGAAAADRYPLKRLHQEIFHVHKQLFIVNSKPSLISNLRICLAQMLACPHWAI